MVVSNVVKTLVDKHFIKRLRHPSDHRALQLKLTSSGVEIAMHAKEIVKESDKYFFSGIESEELCKMLKKLMADNIEK